VLGAWCFRGRRDQVQERTTVSLLENGLADRLETDQHLEVRIIPAGRSANQEFPYCEVDAIREATSWITAARNANAALGVSSCFRLGGKAGP
jgi:hypothetical protein